MARALGIEITETSVRLAEIDGTPRKFRILGATEVPIEGATEGTRTPESTVPALRSALKAVRPRREQVVLGIPAHRATIREIVVPFTADDQIRKVLKFECESHLPTTRIEDVVVDYHKIGETGPRSRLLIVAVPKAVLRENLEILGRVGIDPTHVDVDAAGLFARARLLRGLDGEDEKEAAVILDLGHTTSSILVATGPHLRMVRCLRMGSESLARAISTDLGIEKSEARTMTHEMLRPEGPFTTAGQALARAPTATTGVAELRQDILKDKQEEFARRLIGEIRRSLASVQLEGALRSIWLAGPAARTPGIESRLASAFSIPVRQLDALGDAEHDLETSAASYVSTPIGLALKAIGHDPLRLEFRQEEFRFTRRFERIQTPLLLSLVLALVLFSFLAINEFKRQETMILETERAADIGFREYRGIILARGQDPNRRGVMGYDNVDQPKAREAALARLKGIPLLSSIITDLSSQERRLTEVYGVVFETGDGTKPPELEARSAIFRFDQFLSAFDNLRDRLGWYSVDKLSLSSTEIVWSMTASNSDTFSLLLGEFEKLEGFVKADPGSLKAAGDKTQYQNCRLEFVREN
jgi:type IV pilus assembly protein PilM